MPIILLALVQTFAQNVGIGTPNPIHSRLEISGSVGSSVALFGADRYGVNISSNNPEIGFNFIYNGGTKTIKTGYAANFGMDPTNGNVYLGNFNGNQSVADFGSISGYQNVMTITQGGNVGLGSTSPSYRLDVTGNQRVTGTPLSTPGPFGRLTAGGCFVVDNSSDLLVIKADGSKLQCERFSTTNSGSFASSLLINPYGGNVGIGTTTATLGRLMVNGAAGNTVGFFTNTVTGGRGVSIVADYPGVYFNSYFNGGHKAMAQGYAGLLNFNPNNGDIYFGVDPNVAAGAGSLLSATSILLMNKNGDVAIGTSNTSSGYKLTVNGNVRTKEVVVETGWADYVFDDSYKLRNLDEVAVHIQQHKHLPGIPSAKEIETNGLKMGAMQVKMMEKIEELTLYVIDLNKEIEFLKAKN